MTGRPFIGLAAALVVEACHWTRVRWEFDDEACGRAWQFTSIAIALAAVLIWLDGSRYTALPSLLSWLPPLLLPLQFVQSYGLRDSLPLGMFSFLARHRRVRNQRLGLIEDTTHFNFGNVTFTTTMVAASVGNRAETWAFLPGLVLLTGWALLHAGRSRPFALIPVLIVAGALALAGQIGLDKVGEWIGNSAGNYRGRFDPNFTSTLIGSRGTIEQSPDILWRLRPAGNSLPPPLLRTASFNNFLGANWQNQRVTATDFTDLDTRLIGEDAYYLLQSAEKSGNLPALPSFTLRGAATAESPLPLPGDTAALRDFALDGIERNSFGTVRVFPKHPVIDGTVFWKGGTNPEKPPIPAEDLQIPVAERDVIRAAVKNLHLRETMDLRRRLAILRSWFHKEFRYTRNLTIQQLTISQRLDGIKAPSALDRFLNEVRAGHCEYFATAATLMLREAGIPARYATGYAVMERDEKRGGFVIRGTHGHAWCRVWDETSGTWIDLDPTPPDWFASISQAPSAMQPFNDFLKRLREDFFIWRNRPRNQLAVSIVMLGIGIGLSGFVLRRLWKSKRQIEDRIQAGEYTGPVTRTPLHALEALARKHLGPRPPGQPFAAWLTLLRPTLPDSPVLDEAIQLHQRLRFDPAASPQDHRERLASLAKQLESALKRR
jgi:protein-glutamine gamma-glutamyltransferase